MVVLALVEQSRRRLLRVKKSFMISSFWPLKGLKVKMRRCCKKFPETISCQNLFPDFFGRDVRRGGFGRTETCFGLRQDGSLSLNLPTYLHLRSKRRRREDWPPLSIAPTLTHTRTHTLTQSRTLILASLTLTHTLSLSLFTQSHSLSLHTLALSLPP